MLVRFKTTFDSVGTFTSTNNVNRETLVITDNVTKKPRLPTKRYYEWGRRISTVPRSVVKDHAGQWSSAVPLGSMTCGLQIKTRTASNAPSQVDITVRHLSTDVTPIASLIVTRY